VGGEEGEMLKWEYCEVWIFFTKAGYREAQITYSSTNMDEEKYTRQDADPMVIMGKLGKRGWEAVSKNHTLIPPEGFEPFLDIKPGVHIYILCKRPLKEKPEETIL
jgi:hypothetical protein